MTTEQFKPNTTVAAVIRYQDQYLYVEERDQGKTVINQPAGHLEANESLLEAVSREVLEETGLTLQPDFLIGIYYFYSQYNQKYYLRFCFAFELTHKPISIPQDSDIIATHWLTKKQLEDKQHLHRSPIVQQCLNDYLAGNNTPLSMIKSNL